MKRFVVTVLGSSVFFLGLGSIVESAGARSKSDERALELVRHALGGDAAIAAIESMKIVGRTTQTISIDGVTRTRRAIAFMA